MEKRTDEQSGATGSRARRLLATAAVYLLPVVLVGAGTVVGSGRVAEGWAVHEERSAGAGGEGRRGPGPTDDVILIGDSITEGAEPALRSGLASAYKLRMQSRSGYLVEDMEPYAIALATTNPEQVVINLGTNDVLKNAPGAAALASMERILQRFAGVRCVSIVTVSERIDPARNDATVFDRALFFNLSLHRMARDHSNVRIIDWARVLRDDAAAGSPRGEITSDSVHPNSLGRKILADLYRGALDDCH